MPSLLLNVGNTNNYKFTLLEQIEILEIVSKSVMQFSPTSILLSNTTRRPEKYWWVQET